LGQQCDWLQNAAEVTSHKQEALQSQLPDLLPLYTTCTNRAK